MPKVTFDTSIFIAYPGRKLPQAFLMSAVVIQELVAGANDKSVIKELDAVRRAYEKENRLLVPNSEDWFQAGRVLNALLRGLKSKSKGRTPKLHPNDKQRIIRDVLIARCALRAGALIITDNIADFEAIKRYCDVHTVSGATYFQMPEKR